MNSRIRLTSTVAAALTVGFAALNVHDADAAKRRVKTRQAVVTENNLCLTSSGNIISRPGACRTSAGELVVSLAQLGLFGDVAFSSIPAGQTVHGVVGADFAGPTAGNWGALAQFPGPAPAALGVSDIIIANAGGVTLTADQITAAAQCTGSAAAPTAPAGKVCVYPATVVNVLSIAGVPVPDGGVHGFKVSWASGAGETSFNAVWAYTAPTATTAAAVVPDSTPTACPDKVRPTTLPAEIVEVTPTWTATPTVTRTPVRDVSPSPSPSATASPSPTVKKTPDYYSNNRNRS